MATTWQNAVFDALPKVKTVLTKWLKRTWALLRVLLLVLVACAVFADVYCEVHGVPDSVREQFERALAERGLPVQFKRIKAGLVRGIRAEGATLVRSGRKVSDRIEADHVSLSILPQALFSRDVRAVSGRVSGATVTLLSDEQAEADPMLRVSDIEGRFRLQHGTVQFSDASGTAAGIRVLAAGTITGLDANIATPTSAPPIYEGIPGLSADRRALIAHWVSILERQNLSPGDCEVRIGIDVDLEHSDNTCLNGSFLFSDLLVRDVTVRKMRGRFEYADAALKVGGLTVIIGRDDTVRGEVTVWLERQEMAAQAVGILTPGIAMRLLDADVATTLAALQVASPVSFAVDLQPSPFDPWQWRIEADCRAEGVRFRNLPAGSVAAKVTFADGCLDVEQLALQLSKGNRSEYVRGNARIWLREREVAAELEVACYLPERAEQMGVALPGPLRALRFDGPPPAAEVTLHRSPFHWRQWSGNGQLRVNDIRLQRWEARQLNARFTARPGTFELSDIHLCWKARPAADVRGKLNVSLPDIDNHKPDLALDFEIGLDPEHTVIETAAGLSLEGSITYNTETGTLNGKIGGDVFPDRMYTLLHGPLHLPANQIIADISCPGPPPRIVADIHGSRNARGELEWQMTGNIAAEEARYQTLPIRSLDADIALTEHRVTFRNIRATVAEGTEIGLDLSLAWQPVELTITNGWAHGAPDFAEVFIPPPFGKQIYAAIWRGVRWSPNSTPRFQVANMSYRDGPGRGNWQFEMDSHMNAEDVLYRGLQTNSIRLDVKLMLPGTVAVENIEVQREQDTATGFFHIATEGLPHCRFEILGVEGGFDPRQILTVINPQWDEFLEAFEFAPSSKVTCKGTFFLGTEPRLHLNGTLKAPVCTYRKLRFEDMAATWRVNESTISWDMTKGSFHGGQVKVTGSYDTTMRAGILAVAASDVDLPELLKDLSEGDGKPPAVEGKLCGNAQLQLLADWSGVPLQLTGNGRVRIAGGNLWRIPFLDQLGQVLDLTLLSRLSGGRVSSLGRITVLEADLNFNGNRVLVPSLRTDGSIISLQGTGEYEWQSQGLNFRVHGETLRQIGILSFALRPLSWVFNAELRGNVSEYKWHLIRSTDRGPRRDEDIEDNGERQ